MPDGIGDKLIDPWPMSVNARNPDGYVNTLRCSRQIVSERKNADSLP